MSIGGAFEDSSPGEVDATLHGHPDVLDITSSYIEVFVRNNRRLDWWRLFGRR